MMMIKKTSEAVVVTATAINLTYHVMVSLKALLCHKYAVMQTGSEILFYNSSKQKSAKLLTATVCCYWEQE